MHGHIECVLGLTPLNMHGDICWYQSSNSPNDHAFRHYTIYYIRKYIALYQICLYYNVKFHINSLIVFMFALSEVFSNLKVHITYKCV